jgi:hypothetical protein
MDAAGKEACKAKNLRKMRRLRRAGKKGGKKDASNRFKPPVAFLRRPVENLEQVTSLSERRIMVRMRMLSLA